MRTAIAQASPAARPITTVPTGARVENPELTSTTVPPAKSRTPASQASPAA